VVCVPLVALAAGLLLARPCAATPFQWEYTGSLKTARFHHTATLLPDGRVLVAGGEDRYDALASAELYDPTTGTWSLTGSLNILRKDHTATLLPNGMVLVTGGT
jgi:galactose oxidase-like protein